MKLAMPILPATALLHALMLMPSGLLASASAHKTSTRASTINTGTNAAAGGGLRAKANTNTNTNTNVNQDARRTNRYWVAPIKNAGLECIDNSIRAGGGKPDEICITEGEALCVQYDYKPMGGRWQFGIKDSRLRLYDPKGEVVYEYSKDATHLCIGEEHGSDPDRYSKERPYLTLYDEKIHEVVGSLTCDGTDGKNDENIGQSSILKLVDQADVGPYADYPLALVKFKKGQTEDPSDDNSLWNITVTEPIPTATGLELETFLHYNADKCEWNSYVDSFEDLKAQIAAATDSDPDHRAKIEVSADRPIVFDSILDFGARYFELSCLGDGCVFDLNGYSLVTDPFKFQIGFFAQFEGIVFENGSASTGRDLTIFSEHGGAFYLSGDGRLRNSLSTLVLKECTLRNNRATSVGGAIFNSGAFVIAEDTVFADNSAGVDGGTIESSFNGRPSFERCQFLRNTAGSNGGVLSTIANESTFKKCRFVNNKAGGQGGVVRAKSHALTFEDCYFEGNSAAEGGVVWSSPNLFQDGKFTQCIFKQNSASSAGGVASFDSYFFPASAFEDCIFTENTAPTGGAIITNGSVPSTNCHFEGNTAEEGAAIFFQDTASSHSLTKCTFDSNIASENGGAIVMNYMRKNILKECVFKNNTAVNWGGAIRTRETTATLTDCKFEANAADEGGGIRSFDSDITCHGCDFHENSATSGGSFYTTGNSGIAVFDGCNFRQNTAETEGGAILAIVEETTISGGSKFECNEASSGGAIWQIGGSIDVSDTEFTSNKAQRGGALGLIGTASSSIDSCLFDQNEATDFGGGAIMTEERVDPVSVTMSSTVFQNNTSLGQSQPSDDIYDSDNTLMINCGANYDNCFCDADGNSSPNVTTNDLPIICAGAGVGLDCPGCTRTPPISC